MTATSRKRWGSTAALLTCWLLAGLQAGPARAADPLASWNDGPAKQAIVRFVEGVTVPPAERIAVFDNDGTLWAEQPNYFQVMFALERVKALAPQHPEWKTQEPFASLLAGDTKKAFAGGEKAIVEIVMASHSGMTTDEFAATVRDWLATARHPRTKQPYTKMVYQPMLELLAYLRGQGFKTYIVSGGGVEFMRVFSEQVYGIPPEQVVGSMGGLELRSGADGKPVLYKLPKVDFVDDGPGKPIGIQKFIGRRPVFAFGNSDGDHQMLQWTAAGDGVRFAGLVHHTDAKREWATTARRRSASRQGARRRAREGLTVVDMQKDWKRIFRSSSRNPCVARELVYVTSCCSHALPAMAQPAAAKKPNILVIFGDDIGWFNPSAYHRGTMGYKTPNIDRIAAEGALFTDWYGQQSCTAGRAAFVTGQSPIRTGLTKVGLPGADIGLRAEDASIAEVMKAQGYATGQFGKNTRRQDGSC